MIVVMMVMVAQRVFASHKQCACTDSYYYDRHLQHCGEVYIRSPPPTLLGLVWVLWDRPAAGGRT